jgi:beta-galactosidase GanA
VVLVARARRVDAKAVQAVAKVALVVEKAAPGAVRMVRVAQKAQGAEKARRRVPSAQSDLPEAPSTRNAVLRRTLSDLLADLDRSVRHEAPARRVPSVQSVPHNRP